MILRTLFRISLAVKEIGSNCVVGLGFNVLSAKIITIVIPHPDHSQMPSDGSREICR